MSSSRNVVRIDPCAMMSVAVRTSCGSSSGTSRGGNSAETSCPISESGCSRDFSKLMPTWSVPCFTPRAVTTSWSVDPNDIALRIGSVAGLSSTTLSTVSMPSPSRSYTFWKICPGRTRGIAPRERTSNADVNSSRHLPSSSGSSLGATPPLFSLCTPSSASTRSSSALRCSLAAASPRLAPAAATRNCRFSSSGVALRAVVSTGGSSHRTSASSHPPLSDMRTPKRSGRGRTDVDPCPRSTPPLHAGASRTPRAKGAGPAKAWVDGRRARGARRMRAANARCKNILRSDLTMWGLLSEL
mmetsp:Transcript_20583/g.49854  ORF Transcript_20583/g.49854 Transcript_20583/m.49854 type:complete len:300 (+) Transcript_20583:102-1001(+)